MCCSSKWGWAPTFLSLKQWYSIHFCISLKKNLVSILYTFISSWLDVTRAKLYTAKILLCHGYTSLIDNIFTPQKHTMKRQICVSGRSADLMLIRTPVARKPVIVPSLCWPQDIIGSMSLKRTESSLLSLYIIFLFGRLNTNTQATDFMGHRLIASFLNSEMAVYCLLRFLLVLALNKCTFTTLIGNLFASKLRFIWSTLKSRILIFFYLDEMREQ